MAHGYGALDAVVIGKAYVTQGIKAGVGYGAGPGPVAHTSWPRSASHMPSLLPFPHSINDDGAAGFPPVASRSMGLYPIVSSAAEVARVVLVLELLRCWDECCCR